MKVIKIFLVNLVCGLGAVLSGLPLSGIGVGFAASFGPAAGMLAGVLSGALFSALPMNLRFASALCFGILGGLFGVVKPRGLPRFLACFSMIAADLLSQVAACALMTPAGFSQPALKALPLFAISAAAAGLMQPVFGLAARGGKYV